MKTVANKLKNSAKLLNVTVWLIIFLVFLISCKKNADQEITCYVKDYYTNEPIRNAKMSFDVAQGSGFFGSVERGKYEATSSSSGSFVLNHLGDDADNYLYLKFIRPLDFDSTKVEWMYDDQGSFEEKLWIQKSENNTLRLKPSAIRYFIHPRKSNPLYSVDTIIVKVYNQTDTITLKQNMSEGLHLLPSKMHNIEITYLKNGVKNTKNLNHYVSGAFTTKRGGGGYEVTRNVQFIKLPE